MDTGLTARIVFTASGEPRYPPVVLYHLLNCSGEKVWSHIWFLSFNHTLHPIHELVLWSKIFKIYLFISTVTTLVQASLTSHLTYYNCFLIGLPTVTPASHCLVFTAHSLTDPLKTQICSCHSLVGQAQTASHIALKIKSSEERIIFPINGAGSNGYPYV